MATKPRPVGDFLKRSSLRELHSDVVQQRRLLSRICTLLPVPLDRHCVAAHLERGRLLLFADSSAWASRLNYQAPALQRQLQGSGIAVEQIRVRVLIDRRPVRAARRDPIRLLSSDNAGTLERVAENIEDAGLREALLRLSRHRA